MSDASEIRAKDTIVPCKAVFEPDTADTRTNGLEPGMLTPYECPE